MDLPRVNDIIRFRSTHIEEDLGIYVQLMNYNMEAFILGSDYSETWKKNLGADLDVNTIQYCKVLRVDTVNNYIDVQRRDIPQH